MYSLGYIDSARCQRFYPSLIPLAYLHKGCTPHPPDRHVVFVCMSHQNTKEHNSEFIGQTSNVVDENLTCPSPLPAIECSAYSIKRLQVINKARTEGPEGWYTWRDSMWLSDVPGHCSRNYHMSAPE